MEPKFKVGDRVSGVGVGSGFPRIGTVVTTGTFGETQIECEDGVLRWIATDTAVLAPEPKVEDVTVRARVLDEAKRITASDRNSAYGEPEDNFQRIADFWNVFLQDKLKEDAKITAGDTAALVIMVKLAREMNAPTEDNKVDIAGYAACWAEVDAKREV